MKFSLTTLDNGLRVASAEMPAVESVTFGVFADVGARFEKTEENGISHFLEHMAFKGTGKRSAKQIAFEFDSIGGASNAYTSQENTVYYAKVLKESLPKATEIIGDIIQNSVFAEDELERERGVILQEIAMHHDSPDDLVFDMFNSAAYPEQPLGRSIIGTPESVSSFKRDDLVSYMNRHYFADRLIVAAAGNLNHQSLIELVEREFPNLKQAPSDGAPLAKYSGGFQVRSEDFEQVHLVMGFPGIEYQDADYYAIQVAVMILGGGMSSRLFQKVREELGIAYSIYSFSNSYIDTGVFGVASATSAHQVDELVKVTAGELFEATRRITFEELSRAKAQIKASVLMSLENTTAEFETIGRHLLYLGRYHTPKEIIERVEAVTEQDVCRIIGKVLGGGNFSFAAIGPIKEIDSEKIRGYLKF